VKFPVNLGYPGGVEHMWFFDGRCFLEDGTRPNVIFSRGSFANTAKQYDENICRKIRRLYITFVFVCNISQVSTRLISSEIEMPAAHVGLNCELEHNAEISADGTN
jgi:hypothetical protein